MANIERGGNAEWDDETFVFLNENDKLILTGVPSSRYSRFRRNFPA